jgi:hypothetical protein
MLKVTSRGSHCIVNTLTLLFVASLSVASCYAQGGRGGISGTKDEGT